MLFRSVLARETQFFLLTQFTHRPIEIALQALEQNLSLNVAIDEYPGGHQVLGKSEELVAYIEATVSDWGRSHPAH